MPIMFQQSEAIEITLDIALLLVIHHNVPARPSHTERG